MRYLTLREVLTLHADLIASSGGSSGLRDLGRLQSALSSVPHAGRLRATYSER